MNNKNCPNCGAPFDAMKIKCPYCGTSYFDLCSVNIDGGEPFWLKFKINYNGRPAIYTMLVRADPNLTMSMEQNTVYARSGNCCIPFKTHSDVHLDMHFTSVKRNWTNEAFCKIEYPSE